MHCLDLPSKIKEQMHVFKAMANESGDGSGYVFVVTSGLVDVLTALPSWQSYSAIQRNVLVHQII